MPWQAYWQERVWSKIGAKSPLIVGLTPDGMPVGGGLINTTPEDMIRYAMIYTPSWNVVSGENLVPQRLLDMIFNMGDPAAYTASTERTYGTQWFGEVPLKNTAQWDHVICRRRDVQARQHGPGHLCRSRPRFLRDVFRPREQRHLPHRHRPFAGLPARGGESACRLVNARPLNFGASISGASALRADPGG